MRLDRCPTCKRRHTRSSPANKRYWALLHVLAEKLPVRGTTYSAEQWHLWARSKWLGCADYTLPSGKTLVIPRSTATLDVAEFSDYMTALEAWANEHDVYLEDEIFA
jgi:NinB protein